MLGILNPGAVAAILAQAFPFCQFLVYGMDGSDGEVSLPPDISADVESDADDSLPPSIHSDEEFAGVQNLEGCTCKQKCYKKVSADTIMEIKRRRAALKSQERNQDAFNQIHKLASDLIDRVEYNIDGTTVCRNMWQHVYGFSSSTVDKYRQLVRNGHTCLPIREKTLRGARPEAYEFADAWSNPWPTSGLSLARFVSNFRCIWDGLRKNIQLVSNRHPMNSQKFNQPKFKI